MSEIETVLIIDDELLVRKVTESSLKKMGFTVYQAIDGTDGLEKIHELKPDLIILDYMMPDLTGLEVAEEIQKHPEISKIPIIMMSGKAEAEDVENAKALGIEHYLQKPVNPSKVINYITMEFLEND